MTTTFTDLCTSYYYLSLRLARRRQRFYSLANNIPVHSGKNRISEIDEILSYYGDLIAIKEKVDKTEADMKVLETRIREIMTHFSIIPFTFLFGEIPGELEFMICIDEHDELLIMKTKDLAPELDNRNIIKIRLWNEDDEDDL